jgi:hypothetical protein
MIRKMERAIYAALSPLETDGWKVYSKVPENAPLPYMKIGYNDHRDWGIKTHPSGIFLVDVHLWSAYNGTKELTEKMDSVIEAMKGLSSSEFEVGAVNLEATPILEESDAMHGVVRMSYKIVEV